MPVTLTSSGNELQINGVNTVTENEALGIGQTYQDVTSERALGVEYTNDTNKAITVIVHYSLSGTENTFAVSGYVDGMSVNRQLYRMNDAGASMSLTIQFIVPPGSTYEAGSDADEYGHLNKWIELRD